MITEHDLQEAIAECQGVRNPTANTCMMLAAFYTIKDKLYPDSETVDIPRYSYDAEPKQIENTDGYESDTDFGVAIRDKDPKEVLSVMDELMEAIQVLNPALYKSVMRKIEY